MSRVPYASAVGSLMYVMVCTRLNIAYALSMVSKFMGNPKKAHWETVKWILRYLNGTAKKGLLESEPSEGCDSVTTEVEFTALTKAIKEALWLTGLMEELKLNQKIITIHCDNQSAIQLINNCVHHESTNHIDIKLHFICEVVEKEVVKIAKLSTEDNPSDMITKVVPNSKFEHCLKLIEVS
uniref:Retrovirus-related Pol polyprotein from transposon TNT 1-94 n=1 Tax=Cannabis sativa TaxID=3483 RepID=A0A803Q761_CANSA